MPDSAHTPWRTLARAMSLHKVQGTNWTPSCDFAPEISADKGIEGVPAAMLHALVNQFMDTVRPLTFKKVTNDAIQKGKLINTVIIHII